MLQKLQMVTAEQYRRKLPHIQPQEAVIFVTFRLKGTLPKHLIQNLKNDLENAKDAAKMNSEIQKMAENDYYDAIDDALDSANYGSTWLKDDRVAKIVADSLHYIDRKDFKLICYCIMSNHVHFIAYKFEKSLYKIMNSLKTYSARQANIVLNRSGSSFWQREYYDRVVRDRNDLHTKIEYVLNNPVKINLINNWKNWKWSYVAPPFTP